MTTYLDDKDLLAFFLRANITDPRDRIVLTNSETISLTNETFTSVISTFTVSHIDNVQLDSNPLTAFIDYLYDIKNKKIVFFQAQTGSLTYDVFGGTGKVNWIFPDIPRKTDLSEDSFPRISLIYVSRPAEILGNFNAKTITTSRIQVDVWSKKNYIATINIGDYESKLEGDKLVNYLSQSIMDKLKEKARELTSEHFRDYIPIESPKLENYNEELSLFNNKLEFFVKSIK